MSTIWVKKLLLLLEIKLYAFKVKSFAEFTKYVFPSNEYVPFEVICEVI